MRILTPAVSHSVSKILAKVLGVLFCFLIVLGLTAQANAGTLYASSATGALGELYIIDAASGSLVQDIGPLNDPNGTNYPITGLAFNPVTGVLYGSSGNKPAATAGTLVTINPTNGLVTVIGLFNAGPVNSSGVPATMADIAFDSVGNLYGVGSIGGPQLYSINILTGQATLVGAGTGLTSTTGGGLAISSTSVFYGTPTGTSFGTYDASAGTFANIISPDKPVDGGYGGLSFDGNGVLYGLNVGLGSPPPSHIVTIDPTTGAVMDIGASLDSLDAIAFAPGTAVPALVIALASGNQVTLRWPDAPGFNLEYKTNLTSGIWLTNTTPPILISGTNFLTLSIDSDATFFRLHQP